MILCCGEALIDMLPVQHVSGETEDQGRDCFAPHCGGAVFNTAIGLGRLDAKVGLFSGVSNDMFGAQLVAELGASNVDCSYLVRNDQPTTLAFVALKDGHAQYLFYDQNSAGHQILSADLPSLDGIDALFFGGISLCTPPAADSYAELALAASGKKLVMIDPNIRAAFIADEPAYRARLSKMIAAADIIKLSDEDLDWLMAETASLPERMKLLQSQGPLVVLITRGADGVLMLTPSGELVEVAAQKAQVVDTVGAGDSFNAGFLDALIRTGCAGPDGLIDLPQDQLEQCVAFGVKVAAVTVARKGANPPRRNEIL